MKSIRQLFLVCLLIPSVLSATNTDTTYYISFNKKYTLRLLSFYRNFDFSISPISKVDTIKDNRIIYSPNMNYNIGGGASYKSFGVQGFIRIPGTHKDETKHGKTTYIDMQAVMYQKKFGGYAFYKKYSGFYMAKPNNIFSEWEPSMPHPLRGDIDLTNIGGEAYFIFNDKKYSIDAACKLTERQKKNAGTSLIMYDVSYLGLNADSSLIPSNQHAYYNTMSGFKSGDFFFTNLLYGYSYFFVLKKYFYITPFLFAGPGYVEKNYKTDAGPLKTKDMMFRGNFRIRTGYNGNSLLAGFIFDGNAYLMPEKELKLQSTIITITVFAGYRF
jgi:hypothetical protein